MESPGQLDLVNPVPGVREWWESWAEVPTVRSSSKPLPCPALVGLASTLRTQTKLAWWVKVAHIAAEHLPGRGMIEALSNIEQTLFKGDSCATGMSYK